MRHAERPRSPHASRTRLASPHRPTPTSHRVADHLNVYGPLYLRTVRNRDEALSLLADIASQGEGEEDTSRSHFLVFVDIFDAWPAGDEGAPRVPRHLTFRGSSLF